MSNNFLSRNIEDLYIELLLANESEADLLSAALQKLAAVVQNANAAGAFGVAATTSKLIDSIHAASQLLPPQSTVPMLLQGLKSLEAQCAGPASPDTTQAAALSQAEPASYNFLAEDPDLLQDFVLEAREHLSVVETQLLLLEQNPADLESTHACFRAIHTIMGIAGFLDLHVIREVAHEGETLLDNLRHGVLSVTPALINVLLKAADFLQQEVTAVDAMLIGQPRLPQMDYQILLQQLRDARAGGVALPPAVDAPASFDQLQPEPTEALAADQIEFCVTAEFPSAESAGKATKVTDPDSTPLAPPVSGVPAAIISASDAIKTSGESKKVGEAEAAPVSRSVKVDMEKLDYLADMVGELVVAQSMLHPGNSEGIDSSLARNLAQLARITADVQKTTMNMRLVPLGPLFQRLSWLVRDVSQQVGKAIDLELSGEDIELDRSMVEELADPLMHMIRNSIDHGIEDSEQRRRSGKNPTGRIFLAARHDAGQVEIQVSDDGCGLNRDKILAKAAQKGFVDPNASISDSEIYNLIFEPAFATAEKVSDLSGRGVGMDVVRRQMQKLRGRIDLRSTPGEGSTFLLRLPLTLAMIDGLVVSLASNRYIIPVPPVKEILHPTEEILYTVEGRSEMIKFRERMLPLVRLSRWLKLNATPTDLCDGVVIVLEAQGKTFGLAADKVLAKQEVVIKSVGERLQQLEGIAGAAILGDGRVGLILDVDAIAGRPVDG